MMQLAITEGVSLWAGIQRPKILEAAAPMQAYQQMLWDEYLGIQPFLPLKCERITDIGAGMAGLSIWLLQHYLSHGQNPVLQIVEDTAEPNQVSGYRDDFSCHTDTEVAKEFIRANTRSDVNIVVRPTTAPVLDDSDLIISSFSWCWHYPADVYLSRVRRAITARGRLIVDVRRGQGQEELLAQAFDPKASFAVDDFNKLKGSRFVFGPK